MCRLASCRCIDVVIVVVLVAAFAVRVAELGCVVRRGVDLVVLVVMLLLVVGCGRAVGGRVLFVGVVVGVVAGEAGVAGRMVAAGTARAVIGDGRAIVVGDEIVVVSAGREMAGQVVVA